MTNPMLRFKANGGSEFPEWEEKTLGDICMYERQRSEGTNFVGTENMLKDFGGVTFDNSNADGSGTLYHPGDTLMSNIRPYLKKAWLADRKGTCSTDVLVFHPTSVEPGYLYWLIASDAFVRYVMSAAKGSKMPRGDKKHIMKMPLLLPNEDEQRKIADLLSAVDDVIAAQEAEVAAWQERKKGVMQKLFSQEVRFKADDGSEFPEWEEKRFGDIWKRIVVKNDGSFGGDKIVSVANMKWAPKDDVRDDYLKTYNLLPSSAIAFEGHRNNSYSYGRFVLNDIGDGIVSHVFVCFEPIADIIPAFWKEYIHAECVMGKILRKCTKSSTMMHDLVVPDFLKQIIFVPSLLEQRKIAECLSSLDDVINQIDAELFAWKEFKKGLLQQMFV